jgi:hypothetical protein
MALNKYSYKSDVAANLYRAAFYLAKGSKDVGLEFLRKSGQHLDNLKVNTKKQRLYSAEKILDQYTKLKYE